VWKIRGLELWVLVSWDTSLRRLKEDDEWTVEKDVVGGCVRD